MRIPMWILGLLVSAIAGERVDASPNCSRDLYRIYVGRAASWIKRGTEEQWPIDGAKGIPALREVLEMGLGKRVNRWLKETKREKRRRLNVIELFGSGLFFKREEYQHLRSITGVRLLPLASHLYPRYPVPFTNHVELHGDLYRRSTWYKIDERLRQLGDVDGFDLIVIRPLAGLQVESNHPIESFLQIHSVLFERAFRRLSASGGLMLIDIPAAVSLTPGYLQRIQRARDNGMMIRSSDTTYIAVWRPDSSGRFVKPIWGARSVREER